MPLVQLIAKKKDYHFFSLTTIGQSFMICCCVSKPSKMFDNTENRIFLDLRGRSHYKVVKIVTRKMIIWSNFDILDLDSRTFYGSKTIFIQSNNFSNEPISENFNSSVKIFLVWSNFFLTRQSYFGLVFWTYSRREQKCILFFTSLK